MVLYRDDKCPPIFNCRTRPFNIVSAAAETRILLNGASWGSLSVGPAIRILECANVYAYLYVLRFFAPNVTSLGIRSTPKTTHRSPTIDASNAVVHVEPEGNVHTHLAVFVLS